jgi:thiamine kinase-like enzyme
MTFCEKLTKKLDVNIDLINNDLSFNDLNQNGVFVEVPDGKNPIKKVFELIKAKVILNRIYSKMLHKRRAPPLVKVVYGNGHRPIAIYDRGTQAENYANKYLLPSTGTIKRIIHKALGVHPSIAGFVVIPSQKDISFIDNVFEYLKFTADQVNCASVLCIDSSKDIYLIFDEHTYPRFALYAIEKNKIQEVVATRQLLSSLLNNVVSKSIGVIEHNNRSFFIEEGLTGQPWFQLKDSNGFNWSDIKSTAVSTLVDFHEVVRNETLWQKKLNIGDVFIEQYHQTLNMKNDYQLTGTVSKLVHELHLELKKHPKMICYFQHGDFCINNLLFNEGIAHIIDWDEFGQVSMPLQDEFSLALSFYNLDNNSNIEQLYVELQICITKSEWLKSLTKEAVIALFLFHLLYRLGLWGSNPNRKGICDWLYTILIGFSEQPSSFFDWLDVEKH